MSTAPILLAMAMLAPQGAQSVIDAAVADVARRFAVSAEVAEVEAVTWTDGSLGCPHPGIAYTQALVPGWRIVLAAGSRSFLYHASRSGQLVPCPPGRAKKPRPAPPT
jgi:hypothetical protein